MHRTENHNKEISSPKSTASRMEKLFQRELNETPSPIDLWLEYPKHTSSKKHLTLIQKISSMKREALFLVHTPLRGQTSVLTSVRAYSRNREECRLCSQTNWTQAPASAFNTVVQQTRYAISQSCLSPYLWMKTLNHTVLKIKLDNPCKLLRTVTDT